MDDNGFAFTGFDKRSSRSQTVPRPQTANRTRRPPSGTSWSSPSTTTASAEPPEVIVISDSDEEQGPPAKKRRLSPAKPATILPGTQTRQLGFRNVNAILRPAQPMPPVLQNRVAMECMRAADQDSEDEDFITAGLYPWIASGERTIAPRVHVDDEQAAEDLSIRMASLSVAEDFRRHPLERIAHLQEHYSRGIWQATATKMFAGRTFGKALTADQYVNTIIQMGQTVIVASAVADGAVDDTPGAYNEKGSLGVWDGEQVHEQRHYFTVNDVASNPNL
ncbi:hypothetical protein L227DRAFT_561785 [Lentinus tigrinus ALCF2SS1-6]|uniref:Uncharacterized protein n=1 Tax=Lentinus tigrinus ALCF2SS1-6 TaxID=1328759 RepID=A0A5C2SH44_9APHY|nr:hypothetical protein L227DRAFT_561785 [Lentinus tigrinus ALCF2SS1-6]